jgi:L-lactate dehydrogenase (cytochrome)
VNLSEVRQSLNVRVPSLNRQTRVLGRSHSIADLRREASRALPRAIFDYLEGGADEEVTLRANNEAYRSWRFQPVTLVDVSKIDLASEIFGVKLPFPVLLAPTGYTRLFHPRGELEVAVAVQKLGIPYVVSTVATTAVEKVASVLAPPPWLQLYLLKDRELSWALLQRAWDSGVRVLEFSTDTAVSGRRNRDIGHGLTIPPRVGLVEVADIARRPRYWTGMLGSPGLEFANIRGRESGQSIREITAQFDSGLTWQSLGEVRERWPGKILLKGPIGPNDARHALECGVDGIHLSNHGGRQLDRCEPPVDAITSVRQAIGVDVPLIVDSGVRHGMDIAVALALGADAVAVGRPYLYGLSAAGASGVIHALNLLREELERTIQLIGVTSVRELRERAGEVLHK